MVPGWGSLVLSSIHYYEPPAAQPASWREPDLPPAKTVQAVEVVAHAPTLSAPPRRRAAGLAGPLVRNALALRTSSSAITGLAWR